MVTVRAIQINALAHSDALGVTRKMALTSWKRMTWTILVCAQVVGSPMCRSELDGGEGILEEGTESRKYIEI